MVERQDLHEHSSSSESSFVVSSFSFACESALSEFLMGLKIKAVSFDPGNKSENFCFNPVKFSTQRGIPDFRTK